MAAWSAFGKIDSMYWMINTAFGIAATTFVGQNFGAGKYDRVKKGTLQCLMMDIAAATLPAALLVLTFGQLYAEDFYLGDRGYQAWREGYESYITRILYLRIY